MHFNTRNLAGGIFVLSAICGLAQGGVATSIIIDDFDSDPNDDMGGVAAFSTTIFSNPFNQSSSFTLDTGFSSGGNTGAIFFNSGIGVQQGATIAYDNGGSGLNLDAGGMNLVGFEMDFLDVDLGFMMSIELGNNGDGPSGLAGVASLEVFVPSGMNQTASWSLGDFIISPGFDINDVDSVILNFNIESNPTASLDFAATEFRAVVVPAPGAMALLGLGGLAIARRRR